MIISQRKKIILFLFLILCLGTFLRIYKLENASLWFDETVSASASRRLNSENIIVKCFTLARGRVPRYIFFITMLKGWMSISPNEIFLKLFSVICGVLSIIMIYRLGELVFSKRAGILSALLLTISPFHIYYSQELTCYSLSMLLALISSYCFLMFLRNPIRKLSIFYILSTLGFIHTHPVNMIFFLIQNIFFYAFYNKDKRLVKKWMFIDIVIFTISLYWLGTIIFHFLIIPKLNILFWITRPDLGMLLQTFMVFSLGYHAAWNLQLYALIIFIICLSIAIFYWRKKKEIFYLIFWLIIPICLIWLISQFYPFYLHRTFFFALPAFYLLIAAGLAQIKNYLKIIIISSCLVLIFSALGNYYRNELPADYEKRYRGVWPRRDYKKAAMCVAKNFREGDIILHIYRASYLPFRYYHQDKFIEYGVRLNNIPREELTISQEEWKMLGKEINKEYPYAPTSDITFDYLEIKEKNDFNEYKRIWLVYSPWWGTYEMVGKITLDWFIRNFPIRRKYSFEGVKIFLFFSANEGR